MTEHWENLNALTAPLLTWYDLNGRTLPWRSVVTPYRTWVSEIMLQQTRVSAVIPYFERFMAELPDAAALATVPEERLLKLWEGLGYYSRARNLQKGGEGHRLGLWRRVAAHLCKSQNAPWHRRLHRRRHRLDQLRRAGRRGGWKSAARRRARQRLRRRHHGREGTKAIHRASQRRHRLSPPRCVQSGDDGPRRDGVPAERRAEVRDLPRANDVRGV